jgi:hypothetical protein
MRSGEDERAPFLRCDALQAIPEANLGTEPDTSWFGGEKGIRTTFDYEPIDALGDDLAAKAIFRLEQCDPKFGRHIYQAMCGRETGDATANHGYVACLDVPARAAQIAVHPPSMVRAVPVIIRADGAARKTIAAATSSGVASLPAGVRPRMSDLIASFSNMTCVNGVSTNVGQTAFTRIWWATHSMASTRERLTTPAFDEQ